MAKYRRIEQNNVEKNKVQKYKAKDNQLLRRNRRLLTLSLRQTTVVRIS
jgi:hypothetical protein